MSCGPSVRIGERERERGGGGGDRLTASWEGSSIMQGQINSLVIGSRLFMIVLYIGSNVHTMFSIAVLGM